MWEPFDDSWQSDKSIRQSVWALDRNAGARTLIQTH